LPDGSFALRTDRPGFRHALAMLASGEADGLVALDLDRTARDPRDLEDLIDVIEGRRPRVPVESVTGSLRLANDADISMARVMVAIANKSSRDTGRRVAAARRQLAEAGRYGGGIRPFGFESDGVTIRTGEAAEIVNAADALLAGVPVRQIVADLRDRGVPTVTGTTWKPTTLREILRRPRNAGLMVHQREIVGPAPWPPILPEPTWRAVCAVLDDPARRSTVGNTPKWLLSGLARCGTCQATVHVWGQSRGRTAYRCPNGGHVQRAAVRLDEYVTEVITTRLARPDAAELVTARVSEPDLPGLRREAKSLRELLDEQARLHARRVIDGQQLAAGSKELRGKLTVVEGRLEAVAKRDPLEGIAGNPDAAKVWAGLDLGRKRAILSALCTITLQPAIHGRLPGGGYLDPSAVQFTWHR
jgi:site-specific DNA recombinase